MLGMMRTVSELLSPLAPRGAVIDDRMIRIDLTPDQLRAALADGRFRIGGAHSATCADRLYVPGAIVPDPPQQLGLEHHSLLLPLLADATTPDSLRVGFGPAPKAIKIEEAMGEAAANEHLPARGSAYDLERYGAGWLLGVIDNRPGEITTIVPHAAIEHLSPTIDTEHYIGLHYDQQVRRPNGWEERLARGCRLHAGRRIVVNVGEGERSTIAALNFSALQFADMFAPGNPDYLPCTTDLSAFMKAYPELLSTMALLHITINAGEVAEIAAANCAHDGSTLQASRGSRCIIFSMGRSLSRRL
jgi:hypothetical protein